MINFIVFSKDRAAQLDLFIRSAKICFKEFDDVEIKVLYKYSNDDFKLGYEKLISNNKYRNISFLNETDFRTNLINFLNPTNRYTVFFLDDNVFINPFSLKDSIFETLYQENMLCVSLRLNPNLTYCYPASLNLKKPNIFYKNDNYNQINWSRELHNGDYGYPMSVDGHVYLTSDIQPYILNLQYRNPNDLEGQMARQPLFRKNIMSFYNYSIIFNNPLNKVQTNNPNKHGSISAESINSIYINNDSHKQIKYNMLGFNNSACHQEFEIEFEIC